MFAKWYFNFSQAPYRILLQTFESCKQGLSKIVVEGRKNWWTFVLFKEIYHIGSYIIWILLFLEFSIEFLYNAKLSICSSELFKLHSCSSGVGTYYYAYYYSWNFFFVYCRGVWAIMIRSEENKMRRVKINE